MKTVACEIITPEKVFLKDEAEFIVAPGASGELGILPGHAQLLSQLGAGTVRLSKNAETKSYSIPGGFIHVMPAVVKIFTSKVTAD